MLHCWYGLMPHPHIYPEVDYKAFAKHIPQVLGKLSQNLPNEPALLQSIAGSLWAIKNCCWNSHALAFVWDLDTHMLSFIFQNNNPLNMFMMECCKVSLNENDVNNVQHWVLIKFNQDPNGWHLLRMAMGALFIATFVKETSFDQCATACILLCSGVPFQTVAPYTYTLPATGSHEVPPAIQAHALSHPKDTRPTVKDYNTYV